MTAGSTVGAAAAESGDGGGGGSAATGAPRGPNQRARVIGTVNSNPKRVTSPPRDAPWRVFTATLDTCSDRLCGVNGSVRCTPPLQAARSPASRLSSVA